MRSAIARFEPRTLGHNPNFYFAQEVETGSEYEVRRMILDLLADSNFLAAERFQADSLCHSCQVAQHLTYNETVQRSMQILGIASPDYRFLCWMSRRNCILHDRRRDYRLRQNFLERLI